jgi:DNA-binding response OmpR family regulator
MAGIRTETLHTNALDPPDSAAAVGVPDRAGEIISRPPAKLRPRVLVVDDERLVRWSLSDVLTAAGYQVIEAQNGREARLTMADEAYPVDVLVIDLKLPDADGLLLVREARRRGVTCPVLVMTADGFAETLDAALGAGATRVIVKPFDLGDLVRLVRQVCPSG